jgi:hypothetical protein
MYILWYVSRQGVCNRLRTRLCPTDHHTKAYVSELCNCLASLKTMSWSNLAQSDHYPIAQSLRSLIFSLATVKNIIIKIMRSYICERHRKWFINMIQMYINKLNSVQIGEGIYKQDSTYWYNLLLFINFWDISLASFLNNHLIASITT